MANGRILLAHANADCQKIYGSVLAYDGYEVDVVSDVESALARIATVPVDLVVTGVSSGTAGKASSASSGTRSILNTGGPTGRPGG